MTAREIYEAVLVEINKENAPSFTLEEFNYALNKAVLALVNEKYNFYASNQQLSDDLRVLTKHIVYNLHFTNDTAPNPTYNPVRSYVLAKCDVGDTTIPVSVLADLEADATGIKPGSVVRFGDSTEDYTITAKTATSYPFTITLTSPLSEDVPSGAPIYVQTAVINTGSGALKEEVTEDRILTVTLPSSDYLHMLSCRLTWKGFKPGSSKDAYLKFPAKRLTFDMLNVIENNTYMRPAANRPYFQVFDNQMNSGAEKMSDDLTVYKAYQNKPKIDVLIGRERVSMTPTALEIDYLKLPEVIVLDDIDIFTAGNDTSQSLELPDYLKNEVVRRISAYLLEKMGDPRIQTHPHLNTEIPSVPINLQQQAAANQRAQQNQ